MKELANYIFKSDLRNAKSLLDSGADINIKYGSGVYPIDAAINSECIESLEFVIENGADVNIDCGLPLSIALDYCIDGMIQDKMSNPHPEALEMVKILLDNGADLSLKDLNGNRPIDVFKSYAPNAQKLNKLKELFRPVIKDIDDLLG